MSNSYFTSSQDLSRKLRESTNVEGNGAKNFFTGLVKPGLSIDESGAVQRDGLAWWLQPISNNADTDSIALQQDAIKRAKGVEITLKNNNTSAEELVSRGILKPGDSINNTNVNGLIRQLSEKPTEIQDRRLKGEELAARRSYELQGKGIEAQLAQGNNNVRITQLNNQYDREALQANNSLQLQLGMLAAEQQDQRLAYDKETRSMDRRDRAIAQILAGLGETASLFA